MRLPVVTMLVAVAQTTFCQAQNQDINTRSLESAYAQLVSFEAQPEIAAARFSIDDNDPDQGDLDISTAKLPFYREFDFANDRRWFVQATASYVDMEQTEHLQLSSGTIESLDARWEGFGALIEGGLLFSLSENIDLATSIGVGVSRLENEMKFTQGIADALDPELDGALYNWDTLASILRASVALRYERKFSSWRLKSSAHLSGSYIDSFDESDRFDGFSDVAGNLGLQMDLSHPIGLEIRNYPVLLIGHLGYTHLLGADRDALGFDSFGEAGLSVGVQKFTLGVLGILGSNTSGWNLQFNYDY